MRAFRASKSPSGTVSLALETVPIPKPTAEQVLVKIKASAVQPSDILNSKGAFSHTKFPRILGRDFAGVVVEGPQEWLNKEVFGTSGYDLSFAIDGGNAEYAAIPINGICIKPSSLSWDQAALIGVPASAALLIIDRSRIQAGESIVVLGATGAVGSWVVWIAKRMSCKVITVGRRYGTDINTTEDPKLESVAVLTNGKGADVVVDTVGDLTLTQASIKSLRTRGRLITISAPRSGSTDLTFDVLSFYRKELSLLGSNTVEHSQAHMTELLKEKLLPLLEGQDNGMPVLKGTQISLDQAGDAYSGKIPKAVMVFEN